MGLKAQLVAQRNVGLKPRSLESVVKIKSEGPVDVVPRNVSLCGLLVTLHADGYLPIVEP